MREHSNREEIEKLLPHRSPFLFVDEIVEATDKRIVARYVLPVLLYRLFPSGRGDCLYRLPRRVE